MTKRKKRKRKKRKNKTKKMFFIFVKKMSKRPQVRIKKSQGLEKLSSKAFKVEEQRGSKFDNLYFDKGRFYERRPDGQYYILNEIDCGGCGVRYVEAKDVNGDTRKVFKHMVEEQLES